ncbi:hypothetical protein [Streptomyces sp. Agncl-13]|uniref:hypothetical protein n=1 Tax=Streptomyces sp. Agncl-13 TaxID=3400628 RepID=UPI003A85D630
MAPAGPQLPGILPERHIFGGVFTIPMSPCMGGGMSKIAVCHRASWLPWGLVAKIWLEMVSLALDRRDRHGDPPNPTGPRLSSEFPSLQAASPAPEPWNPTLIGRDSRVTQRSQLARHLEMIRQRNWQTITKFRGWLSRNLVAMSQNPVAS